ncbi:MAG: hydroxyacylglutathione hydrolase [Gammaproteobacteria bacterium]|nr:hydroxyacylglutathione hydrolase [Gammaproteobacteria bacterium]
MADIRNTALVVVPIPAFSDNYIWLIGGMGDPKQVAVIDPGDANPVLEFLNMHDLSLQAILITHHHPDHVGGVAQLKQKFDVPIYGPAKENISHCTNPLDGGDHVQLDTLNLSFKVINTPGHTAGHIAYIGHQLLFCGDTLFSAGCGRLFEGTPQQLYHSLVKLAELPGDTRTYCTHEYTEANLRFARTVLPNDQALIDYEKVVQQLRANNRPTLPTTVELERRINPFLRCHTAAVRQSVEQHLGHSIATELDVFAALRQWKDGFSG